jgi:signal transduction histidine kinase
MDVLGVVKRSPFVLPLACIAAVAMVFISEGSYWRAVGTLDDLGAMGLARSHLQGLAQGVLDAESGQRGYLLTGRHEYLGPYQGALRRIDESFAFLDPYYGRQPESAELLLRLHALTQAKLSELAETIRAQDRGRTDLARELVLSDIGKEKMEAIRALGAQLLALETRNVADSRAAVYRTLLISRLGVALLTACSLLALAMYLRQNAVLEQQRGERQRLVRSERDRLEIEVARRTEQLTELTSHLQTAREDERSRLARDLHDELGALLTSAKLDAARIRSRLADGAPEAQERLAHLVGTLNSGIALKRRIIEDLRPSALSNLGLLAALEILTREFAEQSGLAVHCALEPVELDADAALVVYRLVQEAINNIAKHARATQLWVGLDTRAGRVEVSVRDDGVGFDPALRPRSAHGLVGMRYRVEAAGGQMQVESAPGRGTQISASLPLAAAGGPPAAVA